MITTESIHRILLAMGVRPETAGLFAPHLHAAAVKWGVSVAALPMFLAQLAHESAMFERMVESLNYTKAAQIRRTWPKRFANNSAAVAFVRKPERLANFVY
ncbi:MAG TPA: glycoside hydrolase family 19 protein, partial [Plasticicumulans sp.]|nr:glycoside hydrolase family 19 protein [Plasticicumulans sp.]